MVRTVNKAFDIFLKDYVNLDETENSNARKSRDWLINQIKKFPQDYDNFPKLYHSRIITFGSFARKTKIKPLDDIDLLICISAEGATYSEISTDNIIMENTKNNAQLSQLLENNEINSRKVIEKFKSCVSGIDQYSSSSIKRDHEALTLDLKTYDWKFDIVPCFFTAPEIDGRQYYLIPNGNGRWKKTNPIIDQNNVSSTNQKHGGKILNIIRLIKYWNKYQKVRKIQSYLLENIIIAYYYNKESIYDIKYEFKNIMHCFQVLPQIIPDPQGIHKEYHIDYMDLFSIRQRAKEDYNHALYALNLEENGDIEEAINEWKKVFGKNFPDYS